MKMIIVFSIVLLCAGFMQFTLLDAIAIPGQAVPFAELDQVVALGCGQNPSTTGNSNCTWSSSCEDQYYNWLTPWHGRICLNPGTACGSCSGGTDITCQGAIQPSNPDGCIM